MPPVKVLIADDSVVYRSQVRAALSRHAWIEVVGVASNGRLALERLGAQSVDLLILDLEMPEMDGLETLREIGRRQIVVRTLVFSSASRRGAEATLEALRLGAADFIPKPGPEIAQGPTAAPEERIASRLEPALRAFFPERFRAVAADPSVVVSAPPARTGAAWGAFAPSAIVIASSTGGPAALERVISALSAPLPIPVLVVQHMPPVFTASLAERLARVSRIPCREAQDGETPRPGCVYLAPGDYHLQVVGAGNAPLLRLDRGPQVNSVRPAADLLFQSAARIYGAGCLGVVLTGMGHDGRDGALAIRAAGGAVLIQDRDSCVVNGMPGAVAECGAYDEIVQIDTMASRLEAIAGRGGQNERKKGVVHA